MDNSSKSFLENKIYLTIKKAIVDRELAPGDKLSEESLAQMLHVSRTPIRSALKRLSYERLVQIIPNRGAYVTQPTVKEVKEVFEMRILLEGYAVVKACENIELHAGLLERLEDSIKSEEKAYEKNDFGEVLGHVMNLHVEIASLAQNEMLKNNIQNLIALTNIYLTFYSDINLDKPDSPREHREIMNAIKSKNTDLAKQIMTEHIHAIIGRLNFELIRNPRNVNDVILKHYQV